MRVSIVFATLALALTVNADITQQVMSDSIQDINGDTIQQQQSQADKNEFIEGEAAIEETTFAEEEQVVETDPIEGCIHGLSTVEPQFDELTSIVYSFNSTNFNQGLDDAVSIASNISVMIKNLETTTTDCCRMPAPLSIDDSKRVNEKLDLLTPQIKANMKAFTYEKRAFQSVFFAAAIVKGHIEVLHTNTSAVLNCIMTSTSEETTKATKRYLKQIEYAFQNTRDFFEI